MEIAYLGLFQRVFDWVMSRIFDPIYRFVSNLLTTVFTWIFQEILAPILMPILQEALNFFLDLWMTLFSTQLYLLFSGVLKLIDYLQTAFDVFIGLEDVTYTETGGSVISGTLVEVLMQQKTVSTVFWLITLGALGLAMMLTIYATAKSAFDLDFENKRPVSKVLAAMMRTFVQFFTVPFLVYFLLKLAAVILRGVTDAFTASGNTTLGRIVFTIASLNAAKEEAYNLSTATGNIVLGTSPADVIRYPFYSMGGNGVSSKDYGDLNAVTELFELADFDYLIGFIAAAFLLFTIGVCLIVFVQRIFELVLLYMVSPYFVCMIPLDDGEKFGRWREMFVSKCFTGFGSAIGMRLYLMICPMVMGNQIRFGSASSPEMDYMMKLFFLAGGAWAVYKSGSMITSLLNYQAGMSESTTAATVGGMMYAYTAGAAIGKGRQAITGAFHSKGKAGKDAAGGKADGKAQGGSGSQFEDEQPDLVKQKYTGASGWAARHMMGSKFVNKRLNKGVGKIKGMTLKVVNANKRVGKLAGYTSSFTGWLSGKNKAPEERGRFRRAAAKISQKTGNIKEVAERNVKNFNEIGRNLEEIEGATQKKWGLLSLQVERDAQREAEAAAEAAEKQKALSEKPQKLDIQIGRYRLLNKDSTVGTDKQGNLSSWKFAMPEGRRADGAYYRPTYRMASGSVGKVKKSEASVAGEQAKHSDISIKGKTIKSESLAARRHTISGPADLAKLSGEGAKNGSGGADAGGGGTAQNAGGTKAWRNTISGVEVRIDRREEK